MDYVHQHAHLCTAGNDVDAHGDEGSGSGRRVGLLLERRIPFARRTLHRGRREHRPAAERRLRLDGPRPRKVGRRALSRRRADTREPGGDVGSGKTYRWYVVTLWLRLVPQLVRW